MSLQVVANFRIIDESDDWITVDKPAPLIVHPANNKPEPTLLGGLEMLLAYEMENGGFPAIVTRLDRETSGIVLVAKHTAAARELGMIFERREALKEYLAIVHGWPDYDEWIIDAPLIRAGEIGKSAIWVRQTVHPEGKQSLTRFSVERRFERDSKRFSLIRCFPETGRMHQIRVHLSHAGHPIVGDKIYSDRGADYIEWMATGWTVELANRLLLPRHALHAGRLQLQIGGIPNDWQSPMPMDFLEFMAGESISETPGVAIWSRHD
jgi:23S rRNA pseudouridine1911/1915/1917 synthase